MGLGVGSVSTMGLTDVTSTALAASRSAMGVAAFMVLWRDNAGQEHSQRGAARAVKTHATGGRTQLVPGTSQNRAKCETRRLYRRQRARSFRPPALPAVVAHQTIAARNRLIDHHGLLFKFHFQLHLSGNHQHVFSSDHHPCVGQCCDDASTRQGGRERSATLRRVEGKHSSSHTRDLFACAVVSSPPSASPV